MQPTRKLGCCLVKYYLEIKAHKQGNIGTTYIVLLYFCDSNPKMQRNFTRTIMAKTFEDEGLEPIINAMYMEDWKWMYLWWLLVTKLCSLLSYHLERLVDHE